MAICLQGGEEIEWRFTDLGIQNLLNFKRTTLLVLIIVVIPRIRGSFGRCLFGFAANLGI
jgi:hypothetical protein